MSSALAESGFECYLGTKSNINQLAKNLNNYIYIDKGYHAGVSESLYAHIHCNNGLIVNLDEEGGVDFYDHSTLKQRYSKNLFDNSNTVFLWGKNQKELIEKKIGKSNKMLVSGHPRFELLKPKFHFLYDDEKNKIIQKYGDFLLVNTNMSFGNNIKGDEFILSNYSDRFKNIQKIIDFDKVKLDLFINMIKKLSRDTDLKIILRPHPEEDIKTYYSALQDINNTHVIYDGSVVPWILAAKELIHPDCTTAIEAACLGKIPLSLMPKYYTQDFVTRAPMEVSKRFTEIEDLGSYLLGNNINEYDDLKALEILDGYFSYTQPSTELIVAKLNELKKKYSYIGKKTSLSRELLIINLKEYISLLRKNQNLSFVRNKLKGFSHKNIIMIQKILKKNNIFLNVKLTKLSHGLFSFKK